MNGTAEQQLAILQNADVHGKLFCVFEVLLSLLQRKQNRNLKQEQFLLK